VKNETIPTDNASKNPCSTALNYAPDLNKPEFLPVRYIKVNFHFMDHPDRLYNFKEEEGRAYAKSLIRHANENLRKNNKMNLPEGNDTPVLPLRYQYIISPDPSKPGDDGIYFDQDPDIWFLNKKDKRGENGLYSDAVYSKFGIQKEAVLNIFMMEHHPDSILSPTYKVASNGIGKSYFVKISNCYFNNKETIAKKVSKGAWFAAGLLNHEVGHTLGLFHSWTRNDGCDDTPPHDNCWGNTGEPPCDGVISNNMMDYNKFSNALSPCQIAKMHYNMTKDNSSQRKLLRKDWCNHHLDKTITIANNEKVEWFSSKDILGDIIIKEGASLTIYCKVAMANGSRIKLEPNSRLVLNDGMLFNRCNEKWEGIELVVINGKPKGKIIFYGKPTIADTKNGVEITGVLK